MRSESHELELLAEDLDVSAEEIAEQVKKVTSKTLLEMKKQAQRLVSGIAHAPNLGRTFSYELTKSEDTVSGEVGADTAKLVGGGPFRTPGNLDGLIENGTPHSAPIPHWAPAADKQVPLWQEYLDQAAVDAIENRRA